jgi:hypothetical protein
MTFDASFETAFSAAFGDAMGEPMDYAGPGGTPVALAVPVVLDDSVEQLDGGEYGRMVAPRRTGRAFRSGFKDSSGALIKPVKGGTFTRTSGAVLTIAQAPTGPDSVGEYRFDFGG